MRISLDITGKLSLLTGVAVLFLLAGCASSSFQLERSTGNEQPVTGFSSGDDTEEESTNDPLEPINRSIFSFNVALQKTFLRPVAKGYEAVVPEFGRDRVSDFMTFLRSPLVLANNILQGDLEGAGKTTERIIVNGTVGFFGLFDVMKPVNPPQREDFGQTLGVWGIDSGPYLVLPFLGPSSVRDAAGFVGDMAIDPVSAAAGRTHRIDQQDFTIARVSVGQINREAGTYRFLEQLEQQSLDYYVVARNWYMRNRQDMVTNQQRGGLYDTISTPEFGVGNQNGADFDMDADFDSDFDAEFDTEPGTKFDGELGAGVYNWGVFDADKTSN